MAKRIKKLISIGILSLSLIFPNAVVFSGTDSLIAYAEETELQTSAETEAQTQAATEVQTETQTQPATEAPQTEAPQTEAQTQPVTEAQTEAQTQAATETQTEAQTETITEAQTEAETAVETQTETTGETSASSETSVETEMQTDLESESETEYETSTESESEFESDKKDVSEIREEKELEGKSSSAYSSNSSLVSAQHIVNVKTVSLEYRFTQIDKVYATTTLSSGVAIYESKSESADKVGALRCQNLCYIIEDSGDGWYYIESGKVRGFVKSENIITGDEAKKYVGDDSQTAFAIIPYYENSAYTYTRTTAQEVIAEKVYAIANREVNIYEQKDSSATVTGILSDGALCYILADDEDGWVFVESGQARGFVKKSTLITDVAARVQVYENGESSFSLASVQVSPRYNDACYYTLTSITAADQSAILREKVVNYALQYVGNPYVWGGTSLTNGADCSGFVQTIYAHFGYYLPRVAASQSQYGTQIPVSQASPGDLIFYAEDGYVYHVSMYIGNGQVVHAANSKAGIITSGIWSDAVWAVRVIN